MLKKAKVWLDKHTEYIDSPSKSPDFLVMETWVKPLREKFFEQEFWSGEEGV
jgi:hypothetical protein